MTPELTYGIRPVFRDIFGRPIWFGSKIIYTNDEGKDIVTEVTADLLAGDGELLVDGLKLSDLVSNLKYNVWCIEHPWKMRISTFESINQNPS